MIHRIEHQHELYPGKFLCRCTNCGWVSDFVSTVEEVQHDCPKPDADVIPVPPSPPITIKAVTYMKAYAKYLAAGRPESTFIEILDRYKICSGCPSRLFNDVAGECAACGCYINLHLASEASNKLAWANTKCDLGHWGEISR